MHIKSIKLKGFKSYREAVHVKDISPNHVALIGINGAGKSNFFEGTFEILFFFCLPFVKSKTLTPFTSISNTFLSFPSYYHSYNVRPLRRKI